MVHGVEIIERIDTGFGSPSLVDVEDVRRFAAALGALDFEVPAPEALGDAYPQVWEDDDSAAWLTGSFEVLRRIYQDAADQGQALICWLS